MLKKIISLLVIFAMLAPLSSAVAADEPTSQPTIEEILNGYHEKAFEAQAAEDNGGISTYARGGSSQTLEQETVAELTAAGYEAYNVTSDNYEALKASLQTDFAAMGLDANRSYVIVISGEDPASQANSNARVIDPPTHEDFDGDNGGGGNLFYYTEGNTTYTMRYVTIVGTTSDSELWAEEDFALSEIDGVEVLWDFICDVSVQLVTQYVIDLVESTDPKAAFICNFAMLAVEESETLDFNPYEALDPKATILKTKSAWTRSYIQVYNEASGLWHSAQCSSYAVSQLEIEGEDYFNSTTQTFEEIGGIKVNTTTYSPYYNNTSMRKARAVEGYHLGTKLYDCTGDLKFEIVIPQQILGITHYSSLIITHEECLAYLLPLYQEE